MIRLQHVIKTFPNGALALKDVSFHVPKGEFVFLTGHSGAGKSTLLKMLYAELRPTSGEVRVGGHLLHTLKAGEIPRLRRRIGIIFQDYRLLEDRTAFENVAFALEVTGAPPDTIPAPVTRVAGLDTPIPFTPVLEREYLPTEEDILAAARDLAAY